MDTHSFEAALQVRATRQQLAEWKETAKSLGYPSTSALVRVLLEEKSRARLSAEDNLNEWVF